MKFCIIRKVPFKTPGKKSRIVWGHVLGEREGLALVLVPKTDARRPHSIFIAQENVVERVFESVGPHRFDVDTEDLLEIADKMKMMGRELCQQEWHRLFDPEDD